MEDDIKDVKILREENEDRCCKTSKYFYGINKTDTIYGMGVIGALIYFITKASGLGAILFGIVKAIFWPAVLVFNLLKGLGL